MAGGGAGGGADSELVPLSDGDAYGATTREESEGVKLEDFKRGIRVARRLTAGGSIWRFPRSGSRRPPRVPHGGASRRLRGCHVNIPWWRVDIPRRRVVATPRIRGGVSWRRRGSAEARRGDAADAARREAGPTIGRAGRTRRSGSSIGPFARKNN